MTGSAEGGLGPGGTLTPVGFSLLPSNVQSPGWESHVAVGLAHWPQHPAWALLPEEATPACPADPLVLRGVLTLPQVGSYVYEFSSGYLPLPSSFPSNIIMSLFVVKSQLVFISLNHINIVLCRTKKCTMITCVFLNLQLMHHFFLLAVFQMNILIFSRCFII